MEQKCHSASEIEIWDRLRLVACPSVQLLRPGVHALLTTGDPAAPREGELPAIDPPTSLRIATLMSG
jgi:hypothetical protein